MSEFEYASVVVSIVLALGMADILRFLADTLRDPSERRGYWVHMLWVVLLLELHMEFWWRMWAFRDQLTAGPELTIVLLGPAILFMATRIILPHAGEADMQQLYFQRKNAFFIALVASSLWSALTSTWALPEGQQGLPLFALVTMAAILAVFIACILTANRRFHAVVVLGIFGLELLDMIAFLLKA
jgi:hypothetical protein